MAIKGFVSILSTLVLGMFLVGGFYDEAVAVSILQLGTCMVYVLVGRWADAYMASVRDQVHAAWAAERES